MKPHVAPTNCILLIRNLQENSASFIVLLINTTTTIRKITAKPSSIRPLFKFLLMLSTRDSIKVTTYTSLLVSVSEILQKVLLLFLNQPQVKIFLIKARKCKSSQQQLCNEAIMKYDLKRSSQSQISVEQLDHEEGKKKCPKE